MVKTETTQGPARGLAIFRDIIFLVISTYLTLSTYTLDSRSTEPPKTLIAHTAMLTGLSPEESGKVDNDWIPGETTVKNDTIFDDAKSNGFKTGYFFSKEKLGDLVNNAVD